MTQTETLPQNDLQTSLTNTRGGFANRVFAATATGSGILILAILAAVAAFVQRATRLGARCLRLPQHFRRGHLDIGILARHGR